MEITYEDGVKIEALDEQYLQYCYYKIDGNKLYVYGRSVQENSSDTLRIFPKFKDGEYHKPVKVMADDTQVKIPDLL